LIQPPPENLSELRTDRRKNYLKPVRKIKVELTRFRQGTVLATR
jgi:hypothetical protein